jgi:hypothetical protein
MSKFANRRSPSGPAVGLQLPFYGASPSALAITEFLGLGGTGTAATESDAQYRMPARGRLDTLLINNNPVGTDVQNVVYQARKNGANVGSPVTIASNAAGPVKVDLSSVGVAEGDLVSVSVTSLVAVGTVPVARALLTWVPASNI